MMAVIWEPFFIHAQIGSWARPGCSPMDAFYVTRSSWRALGLDEDQQDEEYLQDQNRDHQFAEAIDLPFQLSSGHRRIVR